MEAALLSVSLAVTAAHEAGAGPNRTTWFRSERVQAKGVWGARSAHLHARKTQQLHLSQQRLRRQRAPPVWALSPASDTSPTLRATEDVQLCSDRLPEGGITCIDDNGRFCFLCNEPMYTYMDDYPAGSYVVRDDCGAVVIDASSTEPLVALQVNSTDDFLPVRPQGGGGPRVHVARSVHHQCPSMGAPSTGRVERLE